jgi:protein gp37
MSTKIEWAEETWNPITGCTKISPGCKNCYAERMAKRLKGRYGYPKDQPFRPGVEHPNLLEKPRQWKKPRMVFVCSMGDIFHENVSSVGRMKVFKEIKNNPRHTFLLLTKRPEEARSWLESYFFRLNRVDHLPNVWLGVTAENQEQADKRIPVLLQITAEKRFVSIEPMLGPINLKQVWAKMASGGKYLMDCLNTPPRLDWVILGGETGPGARPMHPDWARKVRDQCQAANVPFFFKQWGEWLSHHDMGTLSGNCEQKIMFSPSKTCMYRVGKKASGRELDGRTWDQYPEVSA